MGEENSTELQSTLPPGVKPPTVHFTNCVKNDTVMKACATESYRQSTHLMVGQGKMTPEYQAILENQIDEIVKKRATYRTTKQLDVEASKRIWLTVTRQTQYRNIDVAMLVSFVSTQDLENAEMRVCYASCKGEIKDASHASIDRSNELMRKIIQGSLRSLEVPADESFEDIQEMLILEGCEKMQAALPQ